MNEDREDRQEGGTAMRRNKNKNIGKERVEEKRRRRRMMRRRKMIKREMGRDNNIAEEIQETLRRREGKLRRGWVGG